MLIDGKRRKKNVPSSAWQPRDRWSKCATCSLACHILGIPRVASNFHILLVWLFVCAASLIGRRPWGFTSMHIAAVRKFGWQDFVTWLSSHRHVGSECSHSINVAPATDWYTALQFAILLQSKHGRKTLEHARAGGSEDTILGLGSPCSASACEHLLLNGSDDQRSTCRKTGHVCRVRLAAIQWTSIVLRTRATVGGAQTGVACVLCSALAMDNRGIVAKVRAGCCACRIADVPHVFVQQTCFVFC